MLRNQGADERGTQQIISIEGNERNKTMITRPNIKGWIFRGVESQHIDFKGIKYWFNILIDMAFRLENDLDIIMIIIVINKEYLSIWKCLL